MTDQGGDCSGYLRINDASFKVYSGCAAPLLSLRMWWLSFAWLLIGATITNIIVWTPLLLDAALSGTFNGQLQAHGAASADPRAEVSIHLLLAVLLLMRVLEVSAQVSPVVVGVNTSSKLFGSAPGEVRYKRARCGSVPGM